MNKYLRQNLISNLINGTIGYTQFDDDINNIPTKKLGVYASYGNKNLPVSNTWVSILNIPMAAPIDINYTVQLAFRFDSVNFYIRACINGSWSTWREI